MCLAVPGKVIELNKAEKWAVIECYGVRNKIFTHLVADEIALGDYLMVHAGYAIGKIDVEDARETLRLLEELSNVE